ncbi:MAG: hypothetical protein ACRYFX_28220 [Janthinobacterium lividum]
MKIAFLSGLGLLLTACSGAPDSRSATVTQVPAPNASRFQRIKYKFYRDKAGRLFEEREWAQDEGATLGTWYDSTVAVRRTNGPTEVLLSDVIDLDSYQELGNSSFSKDKKRVYYSHANSGGGFRTVVGGADPATFRASPDYQYGFDAKHGYYCDHQLAGLDVRRRQLLYGDTMAHFIAYVKDARRVFYENTPVSGADAPTFHLVRGRAWEAEDKNHRYQCCGQRLR